MSKKNMNQMGEKRGQITIFIIVALLIVSTILIYFLWLKPTYISPDGKALNLESCMENAVEDSLADLGKQAGWIEPQFYYLYNNEKIGYLCYTNLYLQPCINQKPFLKNHFEEQLTSAVKEKVDNCYENSLNELKKKGYDISSGEKKLEISLDPGQILISLDAPVSISRESSQKFTKFRTAVNSEIYDLLMISTSIVQQETKYGDSDVDTLRLFYPEINIDKIRRDDATVYIVEDKASKLKFQFAVRSYAWPAGYGVDTGLVRRQ